MTNDDDNDYDDDDDDREIAGASAAAVTTEQSDVTSTDYNAVHVVISLVSAVVSDGAGRRSCG